MNVDWRWVVDVAVDVGEGLWVRLTQSSGTPFRFAIGAAEQSWKGATCL